MLENKLVISEFGELVPKNDNNSLTIELDGGNQIWFCGFFLNGKEYRLIRKVNGRVWKLKKVKEIFK
jgi:hypothetical protein